MGFVKKRWDTIAPRELIHLPGHLKTEMRAEMNIQRALTEFEQGRKKKLTPADKAKIVSVVEELKLRTFEIRYRNSGATPVFIRDTADTLHIHSTMLVAQRRFRNSVNRGPKPYKKHPHFFALGDFTEK
jgi:hypothetical protein